jgi:hypothetical protein
MPAETNSGTHRPDYSPSSHHPSSRQDAGEGTGSGGNPNHTAGRGGGGVKRATIWTAASPIYAKSKRRRGCIANATRLVYVGLGLTVASELRGFFGPLSQDGSGGATSSGETGYKRSAPGLGGRYGRPASDVGLQHRYAKKKTQAATNTNPKYGEDKDPLADDDWSPDEAPGGIGAAGGIHGSSSTDGIMNAASPMVGGAGTAGGIRLGAPPGASASTALGGTGANTNSMASTVGGFFANANGQMLNQANPNSVRLGGAASAPAALVGMGTTQAIGRDAVQVTTRTTTLGDSGGTGGGGVGGISGGMAAGGSTNRGPNTWEQHLNSSFGAEGSNGSLNNKGGNDPGQVKVLEEKIAMLEGKLSSLIEGDKETDSATSMRINSDEGTKTKNYLRGSAIEETSGQATASGADVENDASALAMHHGLDCRPYGDSIDDEILSDLVYWKDIHEDYSFVGPFHPTIEAAGEDGGAGNLSRRYVTFEVDVNAGFNRNRMQLETMLAMAWAMGRILVLPPKWSLWPHEAGTASYSSFNDYFDLDALTKKFVGVDIVTMEEFLTMEAMAGRLNAGGDGKFPDSKLVALGQSLKPPSDKVDWNGDGDMSQLFEYLEKVALTPAWDFDTCIAAFPKNVEDGTDEANTNLNKMMSGIVRRTDGRPKPRPQSFQGKPTPVDAPPVERLREIMGKRELLCVYEGPMQDANLIHFKITKGDTSVDQDDGPGHWYSSIFIEDHKHDLFVKRLIRDGLRYNDEIQCAAAKVISGIRKIAISDAKKANDEDTAEDEGGKSAKKANDEDTVEDEGGKSANKANDEDTAEDGGKRTYNALHLRRFRHSHQDAILPPSDIGAVVSERFGDGGVVYVATDSKGDEADLLDHIDDNVKIVTLRSFITNVAKVDPKYYGMIDQVVASRSEVFLGTYFSSFTNGVNRLRGYHSQNSQRSKQNGAINSYYAAPKGKEGDMRVYKAISKPFYAREYPLAWRGIDAGVAESKLF